MDETEASPVLFLKPMILRSSQIQFFFFIF